MTDSFYIGAYWGSRAETLTVVANKILQTLTRLSELDEQFLNWYETGMSRKKALEKKVLLDAVSIERICRKATKKGELDETGFARNGFLFGLWTGHADDESSNIMFHVGDKFEPLNLSNTAVLKIPFEGMARHRLLQSGTAKAIINILVEIWHPDYSVLTSHGLMDRLEIGNNIGWLTYRSSIKRVPKTSDHLLHEKLNEGHLFTVSFNGHFDVAGSVHDLLRLKSII